MLERLCTRLGATLRRVFDSRAEFMAAKRFLRNPKVTAREIIATAVAGTAAASVVTIVADREADIYELFARLPEAGRDGIGSTHLLIRCSHDRTLGKDGRRVGTPNETMARWSEAGRYDVYVTARPARRAKLSVRFGTVQIRQPRTGAAPNDPRAVELRLVEVREF